MTIKLNFIKPSFGKKIQASWPFVNPSGFASFQKGLPLTTLQVVPTRQARAALDHSCANATDEKLAPRRLRPHQPQGEYSLGAGDQLLESTQIYFSHLLHGNGIFTYISLIFKPTVIRQIFQSHGALEKYFALKKISIRVFFWGVWRC